ncbi:MAG: hypothetical protein HOV80_29570 [Polyangiaceae bacterium]|nr:hypothetical protein [Polyangiaceae bacterium]
MPSLRHALSGLAGKASYLGALACVAGCGGDGGGNGGNDGTGGENGSTSVAANGGTGASTSSMTSSVATSAGSTSTAMDCDPVAGCDDGFCLDGTCVDMCPADRTSCTTDPEGWNTCCLATEDCCQEFLYGMGYCLDRAIGCPVMCPPDFGEPCAPPKECVMVGETWECT